MAVLKSRTGEGGGTAVPHQHLRVTAMPAAPRGPAAQRAIGNGSETYVSV